MRRLFASALLAGLGLALVTATAEAQTPNWKPAPLYGTLNILGGELEAPRTVNVDAGGTFDASTVGPDCLGFINGGAPDVDLNYINRQLPLFISANSDDADLTLVVFDPNGVWHCNDDHGEDVNPGLLISDPASGNYNIWVGTFDVGAPTPAVLSIFDAEP